MVVRGVGLSVTPSLRRYVEEKLVRPVAKLLGRHPAYPAALLDLELVHGSRHHKKGRIWEAIANLRLPGAALRQRVLGDDLHDAVDELEEVLKREVKRYKERSRSRLLRGARRAKKDLHFARAARLYRTGRIRQEGD